MLFRSDSLLNTKLSRFEIGTDVVENMKVSRKNSADKDKMQYILNTI